jgi:hypothetical protein
VAVGAAALLGMLLRSASSEDSAASCLFGGWVWRGGLNKLVGEAPTPAVVRLGASPSVGGLGRVIKHLHLLSLLVKTVSPFEAAQSCVFFFDDIFFTIKAVFFAGRNC